MIIPQIKGNPTQGARADATPARQCFNFSFKCVVSYTNLELDVFLSQRTRLLLQSLDLFHGALQVHVANVTTHLEQEYVIAFQMPEADYISAIWRNGEWMKLCNALHMISSFADVNNHQVIIIQQIIVTQPDLKQHEYGLPRLCAREKVTDRLSGKWRMPRCWRRWDGGLSVNLSVRQAECTRWMLSLSSLLSDSNCLVRSLLILSGGSNHL